MLSEEEFRHKRAELQVRLDQLKEQERQVKDAITSLQEEYQATRFPLYSVVRYQGSLWYIRRIEFISDQFHYYLLKANKNGTMPLKRSIRAHVEQSQSGDLELVRLPQSGISHNALL